MKKIIMIAGIAIASIGFTYAQTTEGGKTQSGTQQTDEGMAMDIDRGDKDKINKTELPGSVQNSLKTGEFKDWEINDVYKIESEKSRETGVAYEVEVKKEGEKMKLHYDNNGNLVGKAGKDKYNKEGTDKRGKKGRS